MALRAESGGVLLYNAHIESAKNDRFRAKQIDEVLVERQPVPLARPTVFAGDFNTGQAPHESPIVQRFVDEGFVDALGPTGVGRRTSVHHANPLDWIFSRDLPSRTGRVIDAPKASDHYPLEAAFSWQPPMGLATD